MSKAKPKAKHRYTVDEFWEEFHDVRDVGVRLHMRVREGKAHKEERDDLVKQQKHVQSRLHLPRQWEKEKLKERGKTSSNEILVHDIIIETSLKYRDCIITPLRNWVKGEKELDWWHPLYRFGSGNTDRLMQIEWKKELDKALKMAERKDRKEGGWRKEATEMLHNPMTRRINKYEGDYKDGKRHGKGTCAYHNGDWYEGDWKDGKRHGKGTAIFCKCDRNHTVCSTGTRYDGEWKDDKADGIGTVRFVNGSFYEGEFKNGSRHGKGRQYDISGTVYDGEYVNAKREGYGIHTYSKGSYKGYWKDGVHHGKGIQVHNGLKYEGEFKDGMKDGMGTHTFTDGSRYEGEFKDDMKHGKGTKTWPDGSRYDGEWKDGRRWNGTLTNADGSKTELKDGEII